MPCPAVGRASIAVRYETRGMKIEGLLEHPESAFFRGVTLTPNKRLTARRREKRDDISCVSTAARRARDLATCRRLVE